MRDEYRIMLVAWALVGAWVAFVIYANRRTHPKALFFLFMVELWERFSYYGMRALLVLYLVAATTKGGFGIEKKAAFGIYAAYGALVYLTPLAGGYIADKVLGSRRSIVWGAVLMAAGQFTLSASAGNEYVLYAGLALLVTGNGFFKPNISTLVGRFYAQGDPRRDAAFTIFYMGINIGAFLTPLTCGTIGQLEGWGYGFLCAGIGMVVGLLIFLYTASRGYLENHAEPPTDAAGRPVGGPSAGPIVYLGMLLFLPLAGLLIHQNDVMDYLLGGVGLTAVAYMIYLSFQYPVVERQRVWVVIVLLVFTTVFWTFFELAGSALNVFTDTNVDKKLFGIDFPASNYQAVNPIFIMLFAPVFSVMWVQLARAGMEPAAPLKFAAALFLLGGGFLVLNVGAGSAVGGIVPAVYLILLYLLHTLGELALSPVGLSLVTKLAPAQVVGFMMGFWFLSSAVAHQAGKWIAGETAADPNATPEQTLQLAMGVFNNVGLFALASGVLLLALSPLIKKWMHGIK